MCLGFMGTASLPYCVIKGRGHTLSIYLKLWPSALNRCCWLLALSAAELPQLHAQRQPAATHLRPGPERRRSTGRTVGILLCLARLLLGKTVAGRNAARPPESLQNLIVGWDPRTAECEQGWEVHASHCRLQLERHLNTRVQPMTIFDKNMCSPLTSYLQDPCARAINSLGLRTNAQPIKTAGEMYPWVGSSSGPGLLQCNPLM